MAKKIEDAIREAKEAEVAAWSAPNFATDEGFWVWAAAYDLWRDLRAAQARGETTVPDGDEQP